VRINQSVAAMQSVTDSNRQLEQTIVDLRAQADSLQAELDSASGNRKNLVRELADIKEISADAIILNDQNQALVKQNHMLQRENDVLNANLDDLQKDRRNESFLYGGLTVFLGAILVVLIPKLRGRKRFSEWQ
jgi:SH3 domain protein